MSDTTAVQSEIIAAPEPEQCPACYNPDAEAVVHATTIAGVTFVRRAIWCGMCGADTDAPRAAP